MGNMYTYQSCIECNPLVRFCCVCVELMGKHHAMKCLHTDCIEFVSYSRDCIKQVEVVKEEKKKFIFEAIINQRVETRRRKCFKLTVKLTNWLLSIHNTTKCMNRTSCTWYVSLLISGVKNINLFYVFLCISLFLALCYPLMPIP